jgi:coiled-coil domain-containing protein 63/114
MSKIEDELKKEYYELQVRTKNIQKDRKAYNEETQAQLKKHKNMIEKLQRENEQLRNDLIAQANQLTRTKSTSAQRNLLTATEEIKTIQERIEEEEEQQKKMSEDIKTLQKYILEKKRKQKGANGTHERHAQFQKQIRILENRLDKANQKFNEAIAKNKMLRESIDSLRRERVIFDNIYRKLEKELHSKREKMAKIIETANLAYEHRDIAQEELATLIQQAEREKLEFENGLKQINESMKKYNEMNEFMKNKKSEKAELEKMNIDHKNIIDDDTQQLDNVYHNKDKQNTASASLLEKVEAYEETFAKIEAATGITNIDELVNTFKFVNYLSNDIENTEQQINKMKQELAYYTGQSEEVDKERKKQLNELDEKLKAIEKSTAEFELECQNNVKKLDLVKAGIESIFMTLG